MKGRKARGTFATYVKGEDRTCDIDEMAKHLADNVGNVPETIGFGRACEINLLAKAYLKLAKIYRDNNKKLNQDRIDV